MTDMNMNPDLPPDIKPVVPGGLNVLTILTFIGCGIGFIGSIWQFFGASRNLQKMEETINSPNFDSMPGFVKKMMSPEAMELARKQYENRLPLLLIGLVALVLCLMGAINMRKLKMQGYYLYIVGELLPLVAMLIFVGVGFFSQFGGILTVVFSLLFVFLYTAQRKHLVNP